jgi:hypothetical protein
MGACPADRIVVAMEEVVEGVAEEVVVEAVALSGAVVEEEAVPVVRVQEAEEEGKRQ